MSSKPVPTSLLRKTWYKWKALRLPWRKRYLVGLDLNGNTFWEFHSALPANEYGSRMRRIIEYPSGSTLHYSDATSQISPAWHQWLRHVRVEAPSLAEQSQELIRQEQLRVLAKRADERWAAKGRVGDAPVRSDKELGQPVEVDVERNTMGNQTTTVQKPREDPWKRARGTPGEEWQPQAWDPNYLAAKR